MGNFRYTILLISIITESSAALWSQQSVTLLFAGDAMQHTAQLESARTDFGYMYDDCFRYVKTEISSADVAVVNLETTLGVPPYTGYPRFSSPKAFAEALKEAGFDLFLTANNHILDRNAKGISRTLNILDSLSVLHMGSYRNPDEKESFYPLMITCKGLRIAFLNYTYETNDNRVSAPFSVNYMDEQQMDKDIIRSKELGADFIIACLHWGDEYEQMPNAQQKRLAERFISRGVHLVIGTHPHVIQPMEMRYSPAGNVKAAVVYSLGNFISNMKVRNTVGGAMIKVVIRKEYFRTQIDSLAYSLVFTDRPVEGTSLPFVLLPASGTLPKQKMKNARLYFQQKRFVEDSRNLLKKHNININEYEF